MTTKFKQSWALFKASIIITLRHRKLLWFPVLTAILTAFIGVFFLLPIALPIVLHDTGYHLNQTQHWVALKDHYLPPPAKSNSAVSGARASEALTVLITGRSPVDASGRPVATHSMPWGSLCILAIYFVSMFLATFFNVAFYSEIMAALNGKGVSFRRGLTTARSRLPSIFVWSLLAGLVGWLIRTIEQRLPFVGRVVTGLIGLTWSIAAVFAIPVIIRDQPTRNPISILQKSALTLKRTWGEGLIGYLGFSAGSLVMFLGSLVPLVLAGALALLFKSVLLIGVAVAVWVLGLCLMAYVSGVAVNVYRCALFIYATEGVVPEPYNHDLLDMAWKVKNGPDIR